MNQNLIGAAALVAMSMLAGQADAAVTISIQQVGTDIVATASGTFDRTGAVVRQSYGGIGQLIWPAIQFVGMGTNAAVTSYDLSGPLWLTSGFDTRWSSTSGTTLFLNQQANLFGIADSYVNGSQLSATATATGRSFADAGLIAGSYVFQVGANQVTINVGTVPAVPEPASWAMMLAGFAMTGAAMRYRRRRIVVTVVA